MSKRDWIVFIAIMLAWVGLTASFARAEPIPARKQFFADSKKAVLYSKPGETLNCCGEGDGLKVKVIGRSKSGLMAVQITDTMRHAFKGNGTIEVGNVLTVPASKIAKWPRVPELFKSHIVFAYADGRVICFMQKEAGG